MQKLILPIQNTMLTAGYRNAAYRSRFGFSHYGHDSVSVTGDRRVTASGQGTVLAAGPDSLLGNVLILLYPQVSVQTEAAARDVILRYCHLDSIAVKTGDAVSVGTLLGIYGRTGRYSTGAHLHVEADLDTKYFAYSATVGQSGTLVKAGTADTMRSPAAVLHVAPAQTLALSKASFGGVTYVAPEDAPPAL